MREFIELDLDDVIKAWAHSVQWEGRTFNLYIDSPFCDDDCKFCIYGVTKSDYNCGVYKKYYREYLPYMLDSFNKVIAARPLDAVYFGGGTSSLMSISVMGSIFSRVPNLKQAKSKTFEGNPHSMDLSKLKLLEEYEFSILSLGVQSFNERLMLQQGRRPIDQNHLAEILDAAAKAGIATSIDLLAFLELDSSSLYASLKRVENDINKLIEDFSPNYIVVYPMAQQLSVKHGKSRKDVHRLVYSLRKLMIKIEKEQGYFLPRKGADFLDTKKMKEQARREYVLSNLKGREDIRNHKYNSAGFDDTPFYQNTLGLGGYGKRAVYSYFGKDVYYETENIDWKPVFKIYRGYECLKKAGGY